MTRIVSVFAVVALATVGSFTLATAQIGGTISVRGTPIFLVITNSQSFQSKQAARGSSLSELQSDDALEFFYVNQGTNMHRLATMRPRYAFCCKLYDLEGREIKKNPEANNARLDPPRLNRLNIGRYLQPVNVSPAVGPRMVLFKAEDVFQIEKPSRYTLEIALWLWSSKSNALYKSEAIRLSINAK